VTAAPERYEFHHEDETHLETNPTLNRVWHRIGVQPTVPAVGINRRVTAFGSVEIFGRGRVDYGDVNLKTTVAAVGPGTGFLDCSNPAAPKLKFQSAGHVGELAAGAAIVGAIAEIRMYGE